MLLDMTHNGLPQRRAAWLDIPPTVSATTPHAQSPVEVASYGYITVWEGPVILTIREPDGNNHPKHCLLTVPVYKINL